MKRIHVIIDQERNYLLILAKAPKEGRLNTVKLPAEDLIDLIFSLKGKWAMNILN